MPDPKRQYFGPREPFVNCHDDTYHLQDSPGRCGVCGKKTFYKSLYTTEYCCSVECSNELWCDLSERLAAKFTRHRRK